VDKPWFAVLMGLGAMLAAVAAVFVAVQVRSNSHPL
jgi:hydroxyethylthiazole kinase-like sugar kinase family protein